ncbi:MAG: ABC transporter ATP-binding protein [Chloroflexaceae bacterium]|nr:ABC transporter ATP-binding protein [Chloroflexaceae bacterium]
MINWRRLQRLGAYLRPHGRLVLFGTVALLIVNALGVYLPGLIGDSIDFLRETFTAGQLRNTALTIFALASLMWVIRMLSRLVLFGLGRQVEYDLKQRLFSHLLGLEPAYFAANPSGDLINRATSDIDNIRRLVGFALLSLINTIFAYALTLPVMLSINVRLSLLAIAVYPLMLLAVQLFSGRLQTEQLAVQERLSELSQLIQEDMSGIALIKIYAQEENERQAFAQRNDRLLADNLKLARTRNFLFPLVEGLSYVSLLVLLWQGAGAIATQAITVGEFVTLILLVERLVFPTALLGFTITAYQRGEVSVDRVEGILQVQPRIASVAAGRSLTLEQPQGKIEARHLSFAYPGNSEPTLRDLSFVVNPGETVAIVGPIGSGKSTLANILPRLLEVSPGQVFLDDRDITQIALDSLRGAIAFVPQESFLFSTTVKNNIRYGEPVAEQPAVTEAAKQAQIHAEILNFPREYETVVGERGITLSGGQRQRTSLARALLVDAPLLILDDSLSSVDNQTATQILQNLSQGIQRKTVIFISHQLSAAAIADRILVMDRGEIVQSGRHEDLLVQPGLYQSLWQQHQLQEILR